MSKQYTVNLSERDTFDLWQFVSKQVTPKDKPTARALEGVWETFGCAAWQTRIENLGEGEGIKATDLSNEAKPIETGSVDLKTLLGYLDKMDGLAPAFVLRIMKINDELQRVLDGKPKLESVPEEAPGG